MDPMRPLVRSASDLGFDERKRLENSPGISYVIMYQGITYHRQLRIPERGYLYFLQ
jgi:hypothetical protein